MRLLRKICRVSWLKSIWFNFRVFKFEQAIKLPVLLSRNVDVTHCYRGCCEIHGGCKIGILRIGVSEIELYPDNRSILAIWGKIIIKGASPHLINSGTIIHVKPNAVLTIGDSFTCSGDTKIICFKSITIGDDNMWSFNNIIMDTDSHELFVNGKKNINKEIIFGNHVWLGCGNIILKGSILPDNCVVASGSTITGKISKELKESSIVSTKGVIKENITWERNAMIENRVSESV